MFTWTLALILLVVLMWTLKGSREGFSDAVFNKCKKNLGKRSDWLKYDYTKREMTRTGKWKCPQGWEDTGCDWGMDKNGKDGDYINKQCRRVKSVRVETEGANNTCASNTDCTKGRNCGYDGICYDKNLMKEDSKGYCNRDSQCVTGRKCTKPGGKDDKGVTYKGTCQGTATAVQPAPAPAETSNDFNFSDMGTTGGIVID